MVIMEIRPVTNGTNRYCGPAIVSIVAGIDTTRAAKLLRQVSGKRSICGIHNRHLIAALERLGYELREHHFQPGITIANWLRDRDRNWLYVITAGHHYSAIQGDLYCCCQTKKVISVEEAPHRRARISKVWTVHKMASIDPETVVPAAKKDLSWLVRIRVSKKAKAAGIEIDDYTKDSGTIWVYPPAGMFEDADEKDPYCDEHYHDSWEDAEKAVDTYVDLKHAAATKTVALQDLANAANAGAS